MLDQIEGSKAIAAAIAVCRPEVVCGYPCTPQTHIVESLSAMVKAGRLSPARYLHVESEFAAMSVVIGASASGSRTYTASASQGLLYMAEALYNAAGLGLPIVMTVANRAVGAPINVWNDHSDSMALRDCGWIQLYAADNQEAVDLHVQAFLLAEALSTPVMVCVDGFTLTHAVERIDVPEQRQVDQFLPRYVPRQRLDPGHPVTMGAMVGPEAFTEVRYLARRRMRRALDLMPAVASEFAVNFGRTSGGLIRPYRLDGAETVVVAQGSVVGTIHEVVDSLRDEGVPIGAVTVTTYRPFPDELLAEALSGARQVVTVDRAVSSGNGFLGSDVRPLAPREARTSTVVAGLGGRPITRAALTGCLRDAADGKLDDLTFLGLDEALIERELADFLPSGL